MTDPLMFERVLSKPPQAVFDAFISDGGQLAFYGNDAPGWVVRNQADVRVGGVWTVDFGPSPDEVYRHRHVSRRSNARTGCCSPRPRRAWTAPS